MKINCLEQNSIKIYLQQKLYIHVYVHCIRTDQTGAQSCRNITIGVAWTRARLVCRYFVSAFCRCFSHSQVFYPTDRHYSHSRRVGNIQSSRHINLIVFLLLYFVLQLPDSLNPREIHVKAENNGEINVFLCHDTSPENSPNFGQSAMGPRQTASITSHDPLTAGLNRLPPLLKVDKAHRLGKIINNL